jgi:5-methylcytosine-specific restriction endonuclease McrA
MYSFDTNFYKSEEWKVARKKRLSLDNFKCVKCYSASHLEVHHIIPISKNGSKFTLTNLQTLCIRCHDRQHRHRYKKKTLARNSRF